MKNLLKLPVLLLAVILVASCSDSKKEEEKKLSPVEQAEAYGVKMAELECELMIANDLEDQEKMDEIDSKIEKIRPEVEERMKDWGEDSEEAKAAEAAFEKEMENCDEKRAEAEEKAKQDRITELFDMAKKLAKLECELAKEYSTEVEEEILEIQDIFREMIMDDRIEKEVMEELTEAYDKVMENCNNIKQANDSGDETIVAEEGDESREYVSAEKAYEDAREKAYWEEKAYEDAELFADFMCEYMRLMEKDPDSEKTNDVTKKGEELSMELEKIYGPNGSASEEAKKIFEDELEYLMSDCM